MTSKIAFSNFSCGSFGIDSSWKQEKDQQRECSCQTGDELFEFEEGQTQTALSVDVGTQNTKSITDTPDGVIGEFTSTRTDSIYPPGLSSFLSNKYPLLSKELEDNFRSKAFDGYEISTSDFTENNTWWRTLNVDLEKKKVSFPEWNTAKHFLGAISSCSVTRNKERLYDIDYDDGVKLFGVKEEHIRYLNSGDKRKTKTTTTTKDKKGKESDNKASLSSRIQEGVRLHAKITFKGGVEKYVPARVIKVHRGGTYDIECEGGRSEINMGLEDLMLGMEEGDVVEAKRPNKVHLQCTGISWNATGSTLCVSYGRGDIVGWCDYPGAVCTWNVFGSTFNSLNPDFVLEHNSCIMSVKCHPSQPALIVGGSFNGEIIIWDLSLPDQLVAISPIVEYGHKEPVLEVDWVYDPMTAEWLVCSVSTDGKVLFWSPANKLIHPVKGALLTSLKKGAVSSSKNRKKYQSYHGGTALSFSGSAVGNTTSTLPKWFVVGEQGGGVIRGQIQRTLGAGSRLTVESFKSHPAVEDLYPPVRRGDEAFAHESHVGPVTNTHCSPYSRNLFLTSGDDGSIKLFHMFESLPLRQWDPEPAPGTAGSSGAFSSITGTQFSPTRPGVFAAGSAQGLLYLFDICSSSSEPIVVLEAPVGDEGQILESGSKSSQKRSAISGIAFNRKQRDLIAACDLSGRVHIWRLNWSLSHSTAEELENVKRISINIPEDT